MNRLFQGANFSDLLEDYWKHFEDGIQTKLLHEAKIEIDEKGATAATSSSIMRKVSGPEYFECTRPFMFVIHDKKIDEILFAGTYHGPNWWLSKKENKTL